LNSISLEFERFGGLGITVEDQTWLTIIQNIRNKMGVGKNNPQEGYP